MQRVAEVVIASVAVADDWRAAEGGGNSGGRELRAGSVGYGGPGGAARRQANPAETFTAVKAATSLAARATGR